MRAELSLMVSVKRSIVFGSKPIRVIFSLLIDDGKFLKLIKPFSSAEALKVKSSLCAKASCTGILDTVFTI